MYRYLLIGVVVILAVACQADPKVDKGDAVIGELDTTQTTPEELDIPITAEIKAYKTVVNIIRETGLAQNFVILPGDVKDAKAYIKNNERILEYNPNFIEHLDSVDTNWRGISILAREIGHHLSNHELESPESKIEKLEADKYAGFVLYKMGASLEEAKKAIQSVMQDDSTGVIDAERLTALSRGWENAKVLEVDTTVVDNEAKPIQKDQKVVENQLASTKNRMENYVYQVFLALDSSFYFVDEQNIVFVERGGRYREVGVRRESDKPGFDWIFVKGEQSYGVGTKGKLWAISMDGKFHVVGQAVKLNME